MALKISQYKAEDLCGSDFPVFYGGGKLVGSDQLYLPLPIQRIQTREMGCTSDSAVFIRLPYFAVLMRPWAQMPFWTAFNLWRLANLAGVGIFVWLWPGRWQWSLLACAWSLPVAYSLVNGQDVGFLLMWLALAICTGGTLAGLFLSMCAAKFHLFLLLPFSFKQELRLGAGFTLGLAGLLLVCFVSQGWWWPQQFLAAVTNKRIDPAPEMLFDLRGLAHGNLSLEALLACCVLAAVFYVFRYGDFGYRVCAVIVGGLLLTRHLTFSDLALLIPVTLTLAARPQAKFSRLVALFLISPIGMLAALLTPLSEELPRLLFAALPCLMAWELRPGCGTKGALPLEKLMPSGL